MFISIHEIHHSAESSYALIILFPAISDSLIGVHLLIIASVDVYYRDANMGNDISWMSNGLCHFASLLTIFANILSLYTLGFLSISRLKLTVDPLKTQIDEHRVP